MASIFVQIPAYHDYELPRTIRDAINKSSGKHTINFGVHLTYYKNNDIDMSGLNNVKIDYSVAPNNLGQGMSRHIANEFYDGEDYYLQIDSHTRFEQDWDEWFIDSYKFYKDLGLNPVLSCYPGAYEYVDNELVILNEKSQVFYTDFIQELSFPNDDYIPHQRAVANPDNNIFTRSISGGSVFSEGAIGLIKPNVHMYFHAEEILTALRLYTHGYDLLLPKRQNLYHLYYDASKKEKNQRRQTGEDFPKEVNDLDKKSKFELSQIIKNKIIGPDALGSARTLEEYEQFAGIDFALKKVSPVV